MLPDVLPVDPTLLCPLEDVLLPYWPFEDDVDPFEPCCPVEELVLFGFRAVSEVLGFEVLEVDELEVSGLVPVELELRVLSFVELDVDPVVPVEPVEPVVAVDPVPPVELVSDPQVPLDEVPELLMEF